MHHTFLTRYRRNDPTLNEFGISLQYHTYTDETLRDAVAALDRNTVVDSIRICFSRPFGRHHNRGLNLDPLLMLVENRTKLKVLHLNDATLHDDEVEEVVDTTDDDEDDIMTDDYTTDNDEDAESMTDDEAKTTDDEDEEKEEDEAETMTDDEEEGEAEESEDEMAEEEMTSDDDHDEEEVEMIYDPRLRLLRRFLRAVAIRSQPPIPVLKLSNVCVPIVDFVNIIGRRHHHDEASPSSDQHGGVKELTMWKCQFVLSPRYKMEQFEGAFRRNTSLKLIYLYLSLTYSWRVPVSSMLKASTSVKKLVLDYDAIDTNEHPEFLSRSVDELLQASTRNMKELELANVCVTARLLRSIAVNENIERIKFRYCGFAEDSLEQLRRMVVAVSHIKGMTIEKCQDPHMDFPPLVEPILGRNSSLRDVRIVEYHLHEKFTQDQFEEMLRLLERDSKAETFGLGMIDTPEMVHTLASSIPKMKLREFRFELSPDLFHLKPILMAAFRRNTTLLHVLYSGDADFFNDGDLAELEQYASRNRFLQRWQADSDSVPLNLVPRATRACVQSGDYTALFQSIRHNANDLVLAFRQSHAFRITMLEEQVSRQKDEIRTHHEQIDQLQKQNSTLQERLESQQSQISDLQAALLRATENQEVNGNHYPARNKRRK